MQSKNNSPIYEKNEIVLVNSNKLTENFQCYDCDKIFNDKEKLKKHVLFHRYENFDICEC